MEHFSDKVFALLGLMGIDFLFLIPLVVGLAILAATKRPAFAVLKRNFLAYFTNPTGYVFLCLFVALSSIAAFWGDDFFSSNLASLEQLNRNLPLIMLVFIPAITMSIWAEERRQGTDELLLTIPAGDFDIVLGKYLAAVAIFSVSLLFSQICNFVVLVNLGNPDTGLFVGNYFGYWMVGVAMLAIGMVASFLTSNLTVGFILGVVFCAPLVAAGYTNVIFGSDVATSVFYWVVGLLVPVMTLVGLFAGKVFVTPLVKGLITLLTSWRSCLLLIILPPLVALVMLLRIGVSTDTYRGWEFVPYLLVLFLPTIVGIFATYTKADSQTAVGLDAFYGAMGRFAALGWAMIGVFVAATLLAVVVPLTTRGTAFVTTESFQDLIDPVKSYKVLGLAIIALSLLSFRIISGPVLGWLVSVIVCAPFAYLSASGVLTADAISAGVQNWSLARQFGDFQRGVISLSGMLYFTLLSIVMLYLCIVLIGRRHWSGGNKGNAIGWHYVARFIALVVVAASASVAVASFPFFRLDVTSEKLSSLSPSSIKLIERVTDPSSHDAKGSKESDPQPASEDEGKQDKKEEKKYAIKIEAFISKDLPEEFVQKRFNLLSALREIKATKANRISLKIHDGIDIFSEEANRAETLYGIKKETTLTTVRGAAATRDVIFGVAFEYGLEREVVPFMGESLPVEYELMRALATVAQQERKTIGVLDTDARLMSAGGFRRPGSGEQPLIEELRKQYDVKPVDPSQPISEWYDVLLAVQPSSLGPEQMDNFIDAVQRGQPTAIFEDPFPITSAAPGTDQPKQAQGQMFMQQRPQPKGDIGKLWKLLGVELVRTASASPRFGGVGSGGESSAIVWQDYTPHPDDGELQNEYVWITPSCYEEGEPLNSKEPISSGLQKLLFLYPGAIVDVGSDVKREFTELVTMGRRSGTVSYRDCITQDMFGQMDLRPRDEMHQVEKVTGDAYVLAAAIHIEADKKATADDEANKEKVKDVDVVLVSDMDVAAGVFFLLRERASFFGERFAKWQVDNVPFVLNVLDDLAGDDRFIEIRKHRPVHRELTAIKRLGDEAKKHRNSARKAAKKRFKKTIDEAQAEFDKKFEELEARTDIGVQQKREELALARKHGRDRIENRKAELDLEEKDEYRRIDNEMAGNIHRVQDNYKLLAVMLPPIPPLLIAVCVFFVRRSRERESVLASRLQ